MASSKFESEIKGIGQLLTLRKKLFVPQYQRHFSWEREDVEQYFSDITIAIKERDEDYFVGLITLLEKDNHFLVLDGQQRLVVTSAIYASIRHWLISNSLHEDADSIYRDFINVRDLGGENNPRLRLNPGNAEYFVSHIIEDSSDHVLQLAAARESKFSSNRKLLDCIVHLRTLVNDWALKDGSTLKYMVQNIFQLAHYLEKNVKVVILDVDSEANAYIIFESTNARGNELTQLDLVKNYIFWKTTNKTEKEVESAWNSMANKIEGKRADDFLKTFWTSKFGRIAKSRLFANIKLEYPVEDDILSLTHELNSVADFYVALDDANHDTWSEFDYITRFHISVLSLFGSKQVPPPIIAALSNEFPEIKKLLSILVVLIMRFQVVGRGRTGILEINMSEAAKLISSKEISHIDQFRDHILPIMPSDEEFATAFKNYYERKASRVEYVFFMLNLFSEYNKSPISGRGESFSLSLTENYIEHIIPKKIPESWSGEFAVLHEKWVNHIANHLIIEASIFNKNIKYSTIPRKSETIYSKSEFSLTNSFKIDKEADLEELLSKRSQILCQLAIKAWPLPK